MFDATLDKVVDKLNQIKAKLNELISPYWNRINTIKRWVMHNGEYLFMGLTIAYAAYSYMYGGSMTQSDPRTSHNWRRETKTKHSRQWARDVKLHKNQVEQNDYRIYEEIAPVIRNNMFTIVTEDGSVTGFMLNVEGRDFLVPSHYLGPYRNKLRAMNIEDDLHKWIIRDINGKEYVTPMDKIKVIHNYGIDTDLVLVRLDGAGLAEGRKLWSHFARDKEAAHMFGEVFLNIGIVTPKAFMIIEGKPEKGSHVIPGLAVPEYVANGATIDVRVDGRLVKHHDMITYRLPTKAGSCGAVVMNGDKIVGMHTAGSGTFGHAVRITQEMLAVAYDRAVEEFVIDEDTVPDIDGINQDDYQPEAEYQQYDLSVHTGTFVGVVDPKSSTWVQNNIIPYHGHGPEYKPRETVVVDCGPANYAQARAKYVEPPTNIDEYIFKACVRNLSDDLRKIPWGGNKEPLSMDQVFKGIEGSPYKGMDLSTSIGYPLNAKGMTKRNFAFYDSKGMFRIGPDMPMLLKAVSLYESMMFNSITPLMIAQDNLKLERRVPEKKDKPRLISADNIIRGVLTRKYFGPFHRFLLETSASHNYLIGVNPYSDWDSEERRMIAYGGSDRYVAADFSAFDARKVPTLIMAECEVIESWFNREKPLEKRVRSLIYESLAHSYHVRGRVLEQWHSSWPSGNGMTAPGNCIAVDLLLRYAWVKANNNKIHCLPDYESCVKSQILGDDNRLAIKAGYEHFNAKSIAEAVADFGHVYTSDKKDDVTEKYSEREDTTILKRTAVYHADIDKFMPALELKTILETGLWSRKHDTEKIARDNADFMIRELSLHPKETFAYWVPKIVAFYGGKWHPESTDYEVVRLRTMDYAWIL
jgi:hypothetical protein